jgi:hypothetical protein
MNSGALCPVGRAILCRTVVVLTLAIGTGLIGGSAIAGATNRRAEPSAHVAAPCASQGSCQYSGIGGVGTGSCTRAKLEWNVAWWGRNRHHLSAGNKARPKPAISVGAQPISCSHGSTSSARHPMREPST